MADQHVTRRDFLRNSAATAAVIAASAPAVHASDKTEEAQPVLPRRPLGKSGIEVTILGVGGAVKNLGTRYLNLAKQEGIRYIDTARAYGEGASERAIGEWLKAGERREDYFIVDKDLPKSPDEWITMLETRLETLGSDYIDAYFIHALGDEEYYDKEFDKDDPEHWHASDKWPVSREWRLAVEKMKKSGKIKLAGFSSHTQPIDRRSRLLEQAATDESWVDLILVGTNAKVMHDDKRFSAALTACHKKGVALVSMKETYTGHEHMKEMFPEFEARGLTPHTAAMTAVWSDERFSCVLSHMDSAEKLRENAAAARNFKPFTGEEHAAVYRMFNQPGGHFCMGCTGQCRQAGGTHANLNSIARYVAYYEQLGQREEARKLFAALPPEQRDLSDIDVTAASHACCSKVDFARVVDRARKYFA